MATGKWSTFAFEDLPGGPASKYRARPFLVKVVDGGLYPVLQRAVRIEALHGPLIAFDVTDGPLHLAVERRITGRAFQVDNAVLVEELMDPFLMEDGVPVVLDDQSRTVFIKRFTKVIVYVIPSVMIYRTSPIPRRQVLFLTCLRLTEHSLPKSLNSKFEGCNK